MQWLLDRFAAAPERTAFIHEGRRVSYGEVLEAVAGFRDELREAGLAPGARVAVLADYSPEVFAFLLALALEAAIAVPLSRAAVVEEDAALAISGCDLFATFDAENRRPELRPHAVAAGHPLLSTLKAEGRPGLILFSSGSSGQPKAILHDLERVAEKFRREGRPAVAIAFLMIDHFGGINTLLAVASSLGVVVTVAERSVPAVCEAIAEHGVELLPATPSFLTLLLASGLHRRHNLGSLKRITYGTEVMPQSTLDRLAAAFPGVELQQTYGLSEVGVLRSRSRGDGSLWVRLGGAGFETKVVDGVLWVRSQYAMLGYLNAPPIMDAQGWVNTQDRVEVDGEWLKILGRTTDLINVGGQKVYPAEVEDVILELENVVDVAVYGEAHNLLGQIVVAKLVLDAPEAADALKRRVRQACLARLAGYKAPAKVFATEGPLHTARQKKVRRA